MILRYLVPALAITGIAFAVYTVRTGYQAPPPAEPVAPPSTSPFPSRVAGAGLVESSTENIAIGTHIAGIAEKVAVRVGDRVKKGDPLFVIDDRQVAAEVEVRKAALAQAEQTLAKLIAQPRPEDVPPAEAKVRAAEATLNDLKSQLKMWESVTDKRAIAEEEFSKRRYATLAAEARLAEAQAELAVLKAGAWKPDIEIARAQVEAARAQVKAAQTELDRLTVRAPVDCQILQVNIRPGEFAQAGPGASPLMLIGDTSVLHIRVDIDENDAWRVSPNAAAEASLRGNSSMKTRLKFVRIEPYVIPKRSLTGESTERVDTRVLQVIYAFDPKSLPVYVGQQMDISIDAPSPSQAPPRMGKVEPNDEP